MRILIAPNHFKHALAADLAARAIARGILQKNPHHQCVLFPIADGGDGTSNLLHQHLGGSVVRVAAMDPLERSMQATYYLNVDGKTAIMDMAAASGITLLKPEERDPLHAHSFGTGMLIKDAISKGVRKIIIGVGGTATNDGGMGILRALGMKFWDDVGKEIKYPADLHQLFMIDMSGLDARIASCEIDVLCDVRNPLLGDEGATAVFGAQKGATPAMMQVLESGLTRLADKTEVLTGRHIRKLMHSGAAGGAASGLYSFMHARLVEGTGYFLNSTGFASALKAADLVITGEGSLDAQTLQGKGPYGVAIMARAAGVPIIGLAGRISDREQLQPFFDQLLSINTEHQTLDQMLLATERNLEITAANLKL
ncbi:MAG: glycerate kinase [Chitinophagaceae bacterium]